jgi:hypothetical protein
MFVRNERGGAEREFQSDPASLSKSGRSAFVDLPRVTYDNGCFVHGSEPSGDPTYPLLLVPPKETKDNQSRGPAIEFSYTIDKWR